MELNFKGSFFRDLDNINNRYLLLVVKKKRDEIISAKSISQISHLKRFRVRSNAWHKIEITPEHSDKAYWILCTIRNDVVEFRRLKPEGYFKKNY